MLKALQVCVIDDSKMVYDYNPTAALSIQGTNLPTVKLLQIFPVNNLNGRITHSDALHFPRTAAGFWNFQIEQGRDSSV